MSNQDGFRGVRKKVVKESPAPPGGVDTKVQAPDEVGPDANAPARIQASARRQSGRSAAPPFFYYAYWLFLAAVFVLLGVLLFRPLFVSAPLWLLYIQHIALAVVAVCFGFWMGDAAKFLAIREDLRRAVFTTFVVVVLSAAAGYITSIWTRPPALGLRVVPFDETQIQRQADGNYGPGGVGLKLKQNDHFLVPSGEVLRFFVGVAVSNFAVNANGQNDVELVVIFTAGKGRIGDIGTVKQNVPGDWDRYPIGEALVRKFGKDHVLGAMSLQPQESLFLLHPRIDRAIWPRDNPPKDGILRVIARDRITGASEEWKREVTLDISPS